MTVRNEVCDDNVTLVTTYGLRYLLTAYIMSRQFVSKNHARAFFMYSHNLLGTEECIEDHALRDLGRVEMLSTLRAQ